MQPPSTPDDEERFYTLVVEMTVSEYPTSLDITYKERTGRLMKVKKVRGKNEWVVEVKFTATTMMELLVWSDDRVISTEYH